MKGDIFDMEKRAKELGLSDDDIAPLDNPQSLTVGEIRRRCIGIRNTRDFEGMYRVEGGRFEDFD